MKVAILGAGRMAALLTARIPGSYRKVIINRNRARAVALADEVGALASDQVAAVRGCDVIFLAVPAEAISGLIADLLPHMEEGALLVNMATDLMTAELQAAFPARRIVAAKMVGHARAMANGRPGAVVLDHVNDADAALLSDLLGGLGPVLRGNEEQVLAVNTTVAEEMVRAEASLRARLGEMGLAPALVDAAARTMAPGVFQAVTDGDAGPFLQGVLRRIRSE